MRLGGARFVAGESLDQGGVPVLRRLTDQGLLTNTTLVRRERRRGGRARAGRRTTTSDPRSDHGRGSRERRGQAHAMGLDIGGARVRRRRAAHRRRQHESFVRIDMEASARRRDAPHLPAATRGRPRTSASCSRPTCTAPGRPRVPAPLRPRAPLKGAYNEPPEVAYPGSRTSTRPTRRIVETMLSGRNTRRSPRTTSV